MRNLPSVTAIIHSQHSQTSLSPQTYWAPFVLNKNIILTGRSLIWYMLQVEKELLNDKNVMKQEKIEEILDY